jgi:uncharacterized protein
MHMTRLPIARWLLVCGFLLAPVAARAQSQTPVPAMGSAVVDTTGTLTPGERADIEARIAPFEARRGSQMQVLMVAGTQPESIEQYAVRAFAQWKLGRKGVDDGVLVVVARDEHRARVEVGYGLEGAIPDAAASRILRDRMLPKFRRDDYAGGIADGVDALIALADGEPLPTPAPSGDLQTSLQPSPVVRPSAGTIVAIVFACLFASVFLAVPVAGAVYAWRHKRRGFWIRVFALATLACVALGYIAFGGGSFHDQWPPLALMSYLITTFTFASAFPQSSGGGSDSDDDFGSSSSSSSADSSSSSDDSRTGGGGSSGGGGASASW